MKSPIQFESADALKRFHWALRKIASLEASDLHLSVGAGFRVRVRGSLVPLDGAGPASPSDVQTIAASILIHGRKCTRENAAEFLEKLTDLDCSYALDGMGRFRVNMASQRGSLALVLRHIPIDLPTIASLGIPPVIADVAMSERGLILITGVTGSGKSSTMAAMVNHVNQLRQAKVVTIEDPIEFLYRDHKCTIVQRECGSDTESFAKALRAAMRQDPDIILVGEMRDRETIDIAIKAAETGHLVMSTLHTADAPKTIQRVVSVFDPYEEILVRQRLAETLIAVVSQRLLRRADGQGRVAAFEIMRQTKSIQECIADAQRTDTMKDYIEKGRDVYGMQTFDAHLTELYRSGAIDFDTARGAATSPADFERNLHFQ